MTRDRDAREMMQEPDRPELREPLQYVFSVGRRQFLGILGAGLWVISLADTAEAQGQSSSGTLEGRMHIARDGRITILTGKMEEGQGPKTELAMVAAEELGVALSQVSVLMADTDSSPNDGITAGSRTTPSTVPPVRRAAAAARELLISKAAKEWQTSRERIRVKGGAASIEGEGNRKLTYGDLVQSTELAQANAAPVPGDASLTPSKQWVVLGKPQTRIDARAVVTGQLQFPSDVKRPNMLYGSVLRPPSYGAKLTGIDLDAAKKLGEVTVVRDGEFAGCAAATSHLARKAVQALAGTAQWKEEEQTVSNATLFEHLKQNSRASGGGGRGAGSARGSVEDALANAKSKIRAAYTTAYVQHAPMEPRSAVAEWQEGKLTVWTGTSNPFSVRDQLAQAFGIPAARVRVIVPDTGGGFGGKHTGEAAIEAARLAREANRPVSLRWTRTEEFTFAYFRPAALIEIEAALDEKNGILAWDFVNYNSGGAAIEAPYRAANYRTRYVPSDSPLRPGSYRALASTANNFARESFIDELAAVAKADPLEFRMANLDNDRIKEVLLAATRKFGWAERSRRKQANRGVGLACGTEKNSVVAACVEVEVDPQTGRPRLLEICEAYECGAILNPLNLLSQVEGCILMGLGAALREGIQFENGRVKNGRFSAYRVTRFRDVPKMDIILVDKKEEEPVGAGETPIIAVAPAMANAMYAITGRRVRSMPLPSGISGT